MMGILCLTRWLGTMGSACKYEGDDDDVVKMALMEKNEGYNNNYCF